MANIWMILNMNMGKHNLQMVEFVKVNGKMAFKMI